MAYLPYSQSSANKSHIHTEWYGIGLLWRRYCPSKCPCENNATWGTAFVHVLCCDVMKSNYWKSRISNDVYDVIILPGGDVTLTDKPYVMKQLEYNVSANIPPDAKHRIKISPLLWGTDQKNYPNDFDFILGSDLVYCPVQFPCLFQTLRDLCGPNTVIYLSTDMKYREGSVDFHETLLPEQFNSEVVNTSRSNCIYKVTKKHWAPVSDVKSGSTHTKFTILLQSNFPLRPIPLRWSGFPK